MPLYPQKNTNTIMNTLFPYNSADVQKKDALKKMLLAKHKELYAPEKVSFFLRFGKYIFVPLYALLFLGIGFGSLIGVEAFSSPISEFYGKTYGIKARIEVAVQSIISKTQIISSPTLPGLSAEETTLYASVAHSNNSTEALLASKIGRALPEDKKSIITIPQAVAPIKIENNPTITLHKEGSHVILTWNEQHLPSGALPAYYIIEKASNKEGPWTILSKQENTSFMDTSFTQTENTLYRVHVIDWTGKSLPIPLVFELTPTPAAEKREPENTSEPVEERVTQEIPVQKTPPTTPAPAYDFKDETQPLLDFQLTLSAKVKNENSFSLAWAKPKGVEIKGYNVYRDNIKRNISLLKSASFTDTDTIPGKSYQYQIRVVDMSGQEVGKSEKITQVFPQIPLAPKNLSAQTEEEQVILSWAKVATTDFKEYAILRKDLESGQITTYSSTSTSFTDTSVIPGKSYSYTVRTILLTGITSPPGSAVSITAE